jgi:glycosyltransferase involved in cell wall biosynthesis
MRVLWFTEWQPPAVLRHLGLDEMPGPQAWVDSLAAHLRERPGVELTIAAPGAAAPELFEADGVRYAVVPLPARRARIARIAQNWGHRLTPPGTLRAAASLVDRLRPDVVHVHGTEGGFGLLAGMRPDAPLVISLQGILQAYRGAYFQGHTASEVARLVASSEFAKGRGLVHRYLLLRRQARREARVMREARSFIGRTAWDREVLAAVNPGAAYYHCEEIMRPQFAAATWHGGGNDGATVYTTSSALMGKGTECLLEACALLRSRGVVRLTLRVAGVPRGSELDAVYRRAAERFGVSALVDWLGRLDAAAIAAELAAADVFAYPSFVDNSPNSLAEAMLVGTPIVASGVGGIPTMLADGEQGLLVAAGDAAELAAAVERLLADRAAAARLGAAARALALVRHEPGRITDRTLEIYEDVVERARRRGERDVALR